MTGQQLKNSILQLAIQGKLVPQIPDDEPASVLLAKIRKEKERLVKEGKLKKKDLVTTPISDEEKPFEIPKGWEWVRLGDLAAYRKGPFGSSLTKSMFVPKGPNTIKVYEQKNAIQKDWKLGDYYITNGKYLTMQGFTTKPFDIIVSCAGTIGECYQLPIDAPLGIINQALMRVELYELKLADYWMLFFADMLNHNSAMKGAGSAIKNIPPFEILKKILVPLPPLAEQHRIVEKIEQLMPLVEKFGKAQEELEVLNEALPERLRKSVLQEAIQGRLVLQNPDDEPANVLLAKIRKEKERLVKEGKLKKKDLATTPISDEEKPFEIPEGWEWCRIKDILNVWSARRVHEKDWRTQGIPFYRAREIGKLAQFGYVNNELYIEESLYKDFSKTGYPEADDIMMTAVGTLGKCYVVKKNERFYFKDGSVICLSNIGKLNPSYIKYLIESQMFVQQYLGESDGTTVATLTMVRMNNYIIPLPPLAEQHRIVERLEEILSKIDSLKQ